MANYDMAEMVVNDLRGQLVTLVRAVIRAVDDGKVSPWEGMALGMKGMSLATSTLNALQYIDGTARTQVLDLLEYGVLSMPTLAPNAQDDDNAEGQA